MRQFQVPQFIDIEDKIIGPLTLKQFLYLLGAAGVGLLGWFFLQLFLFIIIAIPFAGLFAAMAFLKIGGRPFPTILTNAMNYYFKPRLYLWQHIEEKKVKTAAEAGKEAPMLEGVPRLSESKLSDLAWSLDIKEKVEGR